MKFRKSWMVWSLFVSLSIACGDKGDNGGGASGDGDGDGDVGDGDGDGRIGDGDAGDGDTGDGDTGDGDTGDGDTGDGDTGDGDTGDGDTGDGDGTGGILGMGGLGGQGMGGDVSDGSGGQADEETVLEQIAAVCEDIADRYTDAGNTMCAGMIRNCASAAESQPSCTEEFLTWQQCLLASGTLGTPNCISTVDCADQEGAWRDCGGGFGPRP